MKVPLAPRSCGALAHAAEEADHVLPRRDRHPDALRRGPYGGGGRPSKEHADRLAMPARPESHLDVLHKGGLERYMLDP